MLKAFCFFSLDTGRQLFLFRNGLNSLGGSRIRVKRKHHVLFLHFKQCMVFVKIFCALRLDL